MECWAHGAARRRQSSCTTDSSPGTILSIPAITSPASSIESDSLFVEGMNRRAIPQGHMPHACVVGAGMAGLRAADVLVKRGIKVTIVEGRDRIGGRIHQSSHLGHLADLGPNWIHGTEDNPILDLAKETNTTTYAPPDIPTSVFDEHGNRVDPATAGEQTGLVWEIIGEAYKYSNDHAALIPPEMSLLDFFKKRLLERGVDEASRKQILQIARVWGDMVGEPIEKQSLKFFWLEECIEGENLFLAGTYQAILDIVAKSALANVELQLNTRVTSITSTTSATTSCPPSVTIETANDTKHIFDEVIVTSPLGWLKKNLSAFNPPLPPRLTTAIRNISYGRLEKVYFTFREPFWLLKSGQEPLFTQFISPKYATDTNPEQWSIECTSLASLPDTTAQPTLLFYINGPCAQHVASLIKDHPPSHPSHKTTLSQFFHPYYSRLSGFHKDCQPAAVLATNWIADDLAGNGSYSTFQTSSSEDEESVELDKDIEALREGLPERGVWFAGEHTAPFVALGTVTGAYWSGEGVAGRVARAYGIED